jgi:predicted TIM-barrel fold metal-dependent hydrolase
MYGFHAESVAPNDFHTWERYGFAGGTLADFVELMRQTIRTRHRAGQVVALKCAEAYHRDINFLPDDAAAARKAFGVHPSRISAAQKTAFSNYIFNRACELAAELDVPFQIHTGLAQLAGSDPLRFEPILLKYPHVQFVLFHSGYPWIDSSAGLAFTHRNMLPSLTWTATVSTTAAIRALHEFLDVTKSVNRITWGSDTWVPEESVGALLAWRMIVATVISERLERGLLHPKHADGLAAKLMVENGRRIYLKQG